VIGRVWAVALNTFREAVRDRVLYLLLVVGVGAVAFSKFLGEISVGDHLHVIVNTGLTAVSLLGVMISVFVGTGLIYKEIDKRTVYTILSKPVRRGEFILGKYLGLLLTILVCMGLLSLGFLVYYRIVAGAAVVPKGEGAPPAGFWYPVHGGRITLPLLAALFFIFVEVCLVTAVAVMFSSASTPILSAVLTSVVFAAGRMSGWIPRFMDYLGVRGDSSAVQNFFLQILYYVTPNLEILDLRDDAVNVGVLPGDLGWRLLYALSYATVMLLVATLIFRRRRF
jgi:ABC-type transport system involved in multi-copper enzyme maturation permease subunit